MKLVMLGTGHAAVTEIYNTCFGITDERLEAGPYFLVDCGGGNGILTQCKHAGIGLGQIHDIFITHEHADHLLGVVWMIRMIGTMIEKNVYKGDLRIYSHSGLVPAIRTMAELTVSAGVCRNIGGRIKLIPLESGDQHQILGCPVTFFDIESTKARQFGFTMELPDGQKLSCAGDEPYNEKNYDYVKESSWLMHEAFCLYSEADKYKPYEKHHSTVREACEVAERLKIPNLILYHTEEDHDAKRKNCYRAEGKQYYKGNLYVPDDLDVIEL